MDTRTEGKTALEEAAERIRDRGEADDALIDDQQLVSEFQADAELFQQFVREATDARQRLRLPVGEFEVDVTVGRDVGDGRWWIGFAGVDCNLEGELPGLYYPTRG